MMEEIINKAIEGGYKSQIQVNRDKDLSLSGSRDARYILDKDFWICLGKACGWGDEGFRVNQAEEWHNNAIYFMQMNFTYGYEPAVGWLHKLVTSNNKKELPK